MKWSGSRQKNRTGICLADTNDAAVNPVVYEGENPSLLIQNMKHGNKIVIGSSGGIFLTDSKPDAEKIRKWSTRSREAAAWYQHEELGYSYQMSNVIAGVVRG